MSSSNSTALTKRSASSGLMLPPPAPKRIKRPSVVLDEDTYTSAISHIVRRDFYPGLAEADAQREYLNAVESKDKAWIREAGKNLTQVMTPVSHGKRRGIAERTRFDKGRGGDGDVSKTPSVWGSDTPVSAAGTEAGAEEENDEGLGKLNKVDLNMSLGAFQAKYTSEDQESFSKIIDTQNQKRFDKNKWLYDGNRYASKQRIAQQKVIEAAKSESKELVLSNRPSENLDDRPAGPNMHKHTAFNSLMFRPDGVEDWAPTRAQAMENASLAPPKQVRYNNTRLPEPHESAPARPSSPTLSAIRDAVAGRPRLTPSEGGYTGNETPRVNGYAFVDAHPPTADSDSDSESAPTDLLEKFGVDANSKATPFTINDSSRREKLHHKMVERIGVKQRLGTSNTLSSSSSPSSMKGPSTGSGLGIFTSETPRFLSAPTPARKLAGNQTPSGGKKNMGNLTPAAQRLFERVGGGTPRGVTSGGFGEQGKGGKEWTPTPRVRRKV